MSVTVLCDTNNELKVLDMVNYIYPFFTRVLAAGQVKNWPKPAENVGWCGKYICVSKREPK